MARNKIRTTTGKKASARKKRVSVAKKQVRLVKKRNVKKKIAKAYCPAKQVDENPMIEYAKYLIGTLINQPRHFPEAVAHAIKLEHFKMPSFKLHLPGHNKDKSAKKQFKMLYQQKLKEIKAPQDVDAELRKLHTSIRGKDLLKSLDKKLARRKK